jgi:hypothetical protein
MDTPHEMGIIGNGTSRLGQCLPRPNTTIRGRRLPDLDYPFGKTLASSLFRPRRFTLVVFGGVFYLSDDHLSAVSATSCATLRN